jgi:hypothetical protein
MTPIKSGAYLLGKQGSLGSGRYIEFDKARPDFCCTNARRFAQMVEAVLSIPTRHGQIIPRPSQPYNKGFATPNW